MIRSFRGVHPQIPNSAYVDVSAQIIGDVHLGEQSSVWCNAVLRGDMYYIRIGIGSIVLDDARVGAQSLIAAGSLISPGTIIPPRSLVMGVPGRVKRPLTDDEVMGLDAFWQNYVQFTSVYLDEPK
jgi:carbonic anhydrase/acetyltransferase-like protein (isoleucine patch superfamily)